MNFKTNDIIPVSLEDLVTPWVGSIVYAQIEGQKLEARIVGVESGKASLRVTKEDTRNI